MLSIKESQIRADKKFPRNDYVEEKYLSRPELDEIEKLISAAINLKSKDDRNERLRRAKEIILQATGESKC